MEQREKQAKKFSFEEEIDVLANLNRRRACEANKSRVEEDLVQQAEAKTEEKGDQQMLKFELLTNLPELSFRLIGDVKVKLALRFCQVQSLFVFILPK